VVTYTFTATNTGNTTLTGVAIADPKPGLSALACTPAQPAALVPGATLSCTATRATTQADLDAGTIANSATVNGTGPSGAVTNTATGTVAVTRTPALTLEKVASPPTVTAAGQVVTYTFTATNSGNQTLTNVAITDPKAGLSPLSCTPAQPVAT